MTARAMFQVGGRIMKSSLFVVSVLSIGCASDLVDNSIDVNKEFPNQGSGGDVSMSPNEPDNQAMGSVSGSGAGSSMEPQVSTGGSDNMNMEPVEEPVEEVCEMGVLNDDGSVPSCAISSVNNATQNCGMDGVWFDNISGDELSNYFSPIAVKPDEQREASDNGFFANLNTANNIRSFTFKDGPDVSDENVVKDFSSYLHLALWAKSTRSNTVRVTLQTSDTIPVEFGGECISNCYNGYSVDISLSFTWKKFEIPFCMFTSGEEPVDESSVMSVEFSNPNDGFHQFFVDSVHVR